MKATQSGVGLVSLIVDLTMLPLLVLAQESDAPTPPSSAPRMDLPPGPYAGWPAEKRGAASSRVMRACSAYAGMLMASYSGPKESRLLETEAIGLMCVEVSMPDDWPEKAAMHALSVSSFAAAKKVDPEAIDPASLKYPFARAD